MNRLAQQVAVTGAFDDLRSSHLRLLEEAARLGPLTVWLWPDVTLEAVTGRPPKFPLAERLYLLQSVRFVHRVQVPNGAVVADELPADAQAVGAVWVDSASAANATRGEWCRQ